MTGSAIQKMSYFLWNNNFSESQGRFGFSTSSLGFNPFNIYTLYAVAFAVGLLTVFFDISYQSLLPSLVERDQLVEGNSKLQISQSTAQVAGPTLATAAITLATIPASPIVCLV